VAVAFCCQVGVGVRVRVRVEVRVRVRVRVKILTCVVFSGSKQAWERMLSCPARMSLTLRFLFPRSMLAYPCEGVSFVCIPI
jgi:hypothetical protein